MATLIAGPGQASADVLGIPVPRIPIGVPKSLAGTFATVGGAVVRGIGATATVAGAAAAEGIAIPGEIVAGAVGSIGAAGYAVYLAYQISAHGCWTCTDATPDNHFTFAGGWTFDQVATNADLLHAVISNSSSAQISTFGKVWWFGDGNGCGGGTSTEHDTFVSSNGASPQTLNKPWSGLSCGTARMAGWELDASIYQGPAISKCYGVAVSYGCVETNNSGPTDPTTHSGGSTGGPATDASIRTVTDHDCVGSDGIHNSRQIVGQYVAEMTTFVDTAQVAPCQAGERSGGVAITQQKKNPDGSTSVIGTIGSATGSDPDGTGHTAYPRCFPGGDSMPCLLHIEKVGTDGTLTPWDPTVGDPAVPTEPRFQCYWGPYQLGMDECSAVYEQNPPADAGAGTDSDTDCLGNAVSLKHPSTWFLGPLKCAFIPSQSSIDKLTELKDLAASKPPVSTITEIAGFVSNAIPATGSSLCWTASLDTGPKLAGEVQVLNTCGGQVEAVLQSYRAPMEVLLYLALLLPIGWWAWGAYAPGARGMA